MDRKEVLRMARECGVLAGYEGEPDYLVDFASLVVAAEREKCADLAVGWDNDGIGDSIAAAIRALES